MHEVTVKRLKLLDAIRKNRKGHRAEFEKAIVGYRKAAISEIEAMLSDAKNNIRIARRLTLIEPEDHTADYDRVIMMLEMSIEPNIRLSSDVFRQYVMDEWAWMNQFKTSTASYL